MARNLTSAAHAGTIVLPVDALLELRTLQYELVSIANTMDHTDASSLLTRKHEKAKRTALAKVFRLWAEPRGRSLSAMRSV